MIDQELRLRIFSSLIFVGIISAAIFGSSWSTYSLFFLLLVLCSSEFYRILLEQKKWNYVLILYCLFTLTPYLVFFFCFIFNSQGCQVRDFLFNRLVVLSSTLSVGLWLWIVYLKKKIRKPFMVLLTGWVYLGLPFVFATSIAHYPSGHQPLLIFGLFLLVWLNDSGAYFIGKKWGKNLLAPSISPNKTIEGLFGGLMATLIIALAFHSLFQVLSLWHWLVMAIIVSIASPMGDLLESQLKREHGIKDSGHFMPGHGGALDRFDGFVFCLPFLQLFLLYFYP